jgi:hypothetical protein
VAASPTSLPRVQPHPVLNLTIRIWHYELRRVPSHHSAGRDQQDVVDAIVRGDVDGAFEALINLQCNRDTNPAMVNYARHAIREVLAVPR